MLIDPIPACAGMTGESARAITKQNAHRLWRGGGGRQTVGGWGTMTTMTTPSRKARHPSAEGNFAPRRYVPSSPPLEGWAQPGVVREFKKTHLLPILCHSRAGGNDRGESARANAHRLWRGVSCFARRGVGRVEGSHLSAYSPLSSRAKRGDPVNKKALRAFRPQTLSTL